MDLNEVILQVVEALEGFDDGVVEKIFSGARNMRDQIADEEGRQRAQSSDADVVRLAKARVESDPFRQVGLIGLGDLDEHPQVTSIQTRW